jgi:hypothetical protein
VNDETIKYIRMSPDYERDLFRALDALVQENAPVEFGVPDSAMSLREALEDEVYSLPELRLTDLSEEEKDKLHFIAVPTVHIRPYAQEVVDALHGADYVLTEGVGFTEDQRLGMDVMNNLLRRNVTLELNPESRSVLFLAAIALNDGWTQKVVGGISTRREDDVPVFRSIDISKDDPEYDNVAGVYKNAKTKRRLYGTPLAKARAKTQQEVTEDGQHILYRDQEQFDDISNIAAKAVRLHPEKEQITVGVAFGAVHSMVARRLQQQGFSVDIHWGGPKHPLPIQIPRAGAPIYAFSPEHALTRKAAYSSETITAEEVDYFMVYNHIAAHLMQKWAAISPTPFLALESAPAFESTMRLNGLADLFTHSLTVQDRRELLTRLDAVRCHARMPLFRSMRLGMARTRSNTVIEHFLVEKFDYLADSVQAK